MTDIIHQIIEIAKQIAAVFSTSILGPLMVIAKAIGLLFVKILELSIAAIKWVLTKV